MQFVPKAPKHLFLNDYCSGDAEQHSFICLELSRFVTFFCSIDFDKYCETYKWP